MEVYQYKTLLPLLSTAVRIKSFWAALLYVGTLHGYNYGFFNRSSPKERFFRIGFSNSLPLFLEILFY